jgi:hypothetical protein
MGLKYASAKPSTAKDFFNKAVNFSRIQYFKQLQVLQVINAMQTLSKKY